MFFVDNNQDGCGQENGPIIILETDTPPTNAEIRKLKSAAQHLEPILKIGKAGLTGAFVKALDESLTRHELVKIKFSDFKEQKKELAPQIAVMTASRLIMRVGNVAVYWRKRRTD